MPLVPTSIHWSTCSSVWLHALRDRESKRIPIHQSMPKGDTYGVPSKCWNGVLPSGRTVNFERINPALRIENGMVREIADNCTPVFASDRIVRLPVSVHCFDKPVALVSCSQIVTLFSRFVRMQLFYKSMILFSLSN